MAIVVSIKVGAAQPVAKSFENEVKVTAILEAFYTDLHLGPSDATGRQKLQAIVDWIPSYISQITRHHQVERARDAAVNQAEQDNTFE